MPHFKNPNNQLFWLDAQDEPSKWLSSDCIEITDLEASSIREAQQKLTFDTLPYTTKRQQEYPPISDYLDGIVKGDTAQVEAYIAKCLEVKAKYPKE